MVLDVPSSAGGRVVVHRIRRPAMMSSKTLPSDKNINTSTAVRYEERRVLRTSTVLTRLRIKTPSEAGV